MGMVFCRGCGKEIHESAPTCPQCGAPQGGASSALSGDIPDGVKGWSWGAFLLSWIWAIGNRTWIGLLAIIPYVGFIMAIVLGVKGREWAWKNNQWESVEHFNRVQKKWSFWGVAIVLGAVAIGIVAAISIPAFVSYAAKAEAQKLEQAMPVAPQIQDYAVQQEVRQDAVSWSEDYKTQFVETCTSSAVNSGAAIEYASNFCECTANQASTKIPESEVDSPQNAELIQSMAEACK